MTMRNDPYIHVTTNCNLDLAGQVPFRKKKRKKRQTLVQPRLFLFFVSFARTVRKQRYKRTTLRPPSCVNVSCEGAPNASTTVGSGVGCRVAGIMASGKQTKANIQKQANLFNPDGTVLTFDVNLYTCLFVCLFVCLSGSPTHTHLSL